MSKTLHGSGTGGTSEFTMCGLAFDAHDSGDHDRPITFAVSGETITCPDCRAIIDYYRAIKRYRQS